MLSFASEPIMWMDGKKEGYGRLLIASVGLYNEATGRVYAKGVLVNLLWHHLTRSIEAGCYRLYIICSSKSKHIS